MDLFSEFQRQSLLSGCMSLSHRMAELEARIDEADYATGLSGMAPDLSPVERRILRDYFSRLRQELLRVLETNDIEIEPPRISLRWALQTGLMGMLVAVDDLGPSSLQGYGQLTPAGQLAAERLQQNLSRIIDQAHRLLAQRSSVDLPERLRRVSAEMPQLARAVEQIDEIATRRSLVEYRPQLDLILNRMENVRLEIAVFGRVSSGKSSLLNHIAGQDLLPVGILPVTAVPTRLTWGEEARVQLEFAGGERKQINVEDLKQFASESENPGNIRHVTRIEAQLPSPRLHEGIVFVDTPGLGSLARSGGAETLAYLPRCDLGIVLIDAASTINDEDVKVIALLLAAGTPVQVLLSKADVLNDAERRQVIDYIGRKLKEELGEPIPVYPMSIIGRYEPLLHEWFDREIRPLRERHHDLSRASITRKIVHLAKSLLAALARLQHQHDAQAIESPSGREKITQLLQIGDDVLRKLAGFASRWRLEAPLEVDSDRVFNRAAEAFVAAHRDESYSLTVVRQAVKGVLAEHGRLVWHRIKDAHGELTRAIEELAKASPSSRIDVIGFKEVAWEPLPVADWTPTHPAASDATPWWEKLWNVGAATAVRYRLEKDHRREVGEAISNYDRRLDTWLRDALRVLRAAHEAQTEVVRSESARIAPMQRTGNADEVDQVEHDIDQIQAICDFLEGGHPLADSTFTRNGSANASEPAQETRTKVAP
jgi:GTP-binding protein EngB required for normal cell division